TMGLKRKSSRSEDQESGCAVDVSKSKKSRIGSKKPKASTAEGAVENDSLFVQLLKASGVLLWGGNRSNEITVEQIIFQKKLHQGLRKHPRYPHVIQEFISGLESHIEERDVFRNCLLPCGQPQEAETMNSMNSYQESLIKLLLGIEILQSAVMTTLFEKIPEFLCDSVGEDGINMPRLIINQFKWLDRIVDSKELTSKIMQLISVAPVEIQRDIITSLPEILEDSQHNECAEELNLLLQKNTQLTVAILDTLSSLNLDSGLLIEVRQAVMSTLSAVNLEDLPVVIKFILHAITATEAVEVISTLRRKLELESCVLPPQIQASQSKAKNKEQGSRDSLQNQAGSSQDCVVLILDAIKSAVRFQKTMSEAWIKAIESIASMADHKVSSNLAIRVLHMTYTVEGRCDCSQILKCTIWFRVILMSKAPRRYLGGGEVLRDYFPSILSLAQTLLRSPEQSVVSFGSLMYKQAFTAFDCYCQQEVVGALVTHVCSGFSAEVDVSLDVLTDLVSECSAAMSPYSVFVKGILDYMENLSPQQIRKLFYILSILAFSKGHEGSHIQQDDMYIVIRKQLSSTVSKYKRIGIIGAIMMVGSMAADSKTGDQSSDPEPISKETYRQVTALLELVGSCSEHSPEAAALYYDELANLVQKGSLDPQILEWIAKSVLEDFQENFVADVVPAMQGDFLFPLKTLYNLDEEESQSAIAINLLPMLSREFSNKGVDRRKGGAKQFCALNSRPMSLVCLPAFFRLLRLCEEQQHKGDLEEIDALLGCPLYLTELELVEKLDSLSKQERELLCSLLFYAINWLREVVNAFCKQKDPEMKGKVLIRLQNLTGLQAVLEKCLAATPGYVPPLANFDSEILEGGPPVAAAAAAAAPGKKGKKALGSKKRKLDGTKNSSTDSSQMEENQDGDQLQAEKPVQDSSEKEEERPSVSLSSYRPFLRELDTEVFVVLQSGLLIKAVLDTDMHTKATEVVQLGPAELAFLLDDLSRKLDHILTAAKRFTFLKVKGDRNVGFSHLRQKSPQAVVFSVIQLLNSLCTHLENAHNYFQMMMSENQGVVDGPAVDVKEHQEMSTCYQLLLQVLHSLFAWSGFSQNANRKLLKLSLKVLAGRLKEETGEIALDDLVSQSFQYLMNFHRSVPSCTSALTLTQILIVIAERSSSSQYRQQIASLTRGFLCQAWVLPTGEREKGNRYSEKLQQLLCIYMAHTEDVLKAVEDIAGVGIPELANTAKDGCSTTYPTLTRQTFLVFYRVMMSELEKTVRGMPAGRPTDSSEEQMEKLLRWNLAVRDFHILVHLVKMFDSRPVLGVCLKYGRLFVESFLKLGMPLLDYSFKKRKEDVQSLLKNLQLSTRQLHHMCGHSKIHQDTGLTNHVPLLKKSLELFVYRVKAMLTLNSCQEAFWLGNLKNRDLQGEEILSQASHQQSDNEDEEASEVPEDDVQEEEEEDGSNSENKKGRQEEESEEESD
uniref:FA complementation group D2 n=1 Tax=Latimeria chalumnae TaxID=7897 RepID=H3BFD2_LATCH